MFRFILFCFVLKVSLRACSITKTVSKPFLGSFIADFPYQILRGKRSLISNTHSPLTHSRLSHNNMESKRLACQNCRQKRKKCDLQLPCSRCSRLRVECIPTIQDMRKEKATNTYRKRLEDYVAYLEGLLNEKQTALLPINPHGKGLDELHKDSDVRQSVALFFKWLYPNQFVFIFREAFLIAFLREQREGHEYISEELVYAIAALGASLNKSSDPLYARAHQYYRLAKDKTLAKVFQQEDTNKSSLPKLVLIQTLLCLAFYEIKTGNNELAWYFSGLAFRIVHEIGLHLHSSSWSINKEEHEQRTSENLSQYDTEVRSRIYWGCYLADHLISQLFGRVSTLNLSNSTVPETDELPSTAVDIKEFVLCKQAECPQVANPVKSLIVLSRITSWFVNKIFIQSYIFEERVENLAKFNAEIMNWKASLSQELQWSRESLLANSFYDPTICYVWYHYYMALLSYNKPFVSQSPRSRQLIEESIEDLYLILKNWEISWGSYEKCNLYTVYTAILAIQCYETGKINGAHYEDFRMFLNSPSLNFKLPISVSRTQENNDPMESLSLSNFFDTYNPDFSLLNEINSLLDIDNTHFL